MPLNHRLERRSPPPPPLPLLLLSPERHGGAAVTVTITSCSTDRRSRQFLRASHGRCYPIPRRGPCRRAHSARQCQQSMLRPVSRACAYVCLRAPMSYQAVAAAGSGCVPELCACPSVQPLSRGRRACVIGLKLPASGGQHHDQPCALLNPPRHQPPAPTGEPARSVHEVLSQDDLATGYGNGRLTACQHRTRFGAWVCPQYAHSPQGHRCASCPSPPE